MQSHTKSGVSSRYSSEASTAGRQVVHGIYRREGEFWTIAYGGRIVHIRDTKGLGYTAHLLRHPNTEFHVLDLFAGIGAASLSADNERRRASSLDLREEEMERAGLRRGGIPEDAGEMLDDEAKASYRRRVVELRELLDDAREIGNAERAAELEDEIDSLTRELARAVGMGGRDRRAGSVSERARLNATRAIRSAIERITENDAVIGELLGRTIKTGTFCSYKPGPASEVEWEFGTSTISIDIPAQRKSAGPIETAVRDNIGIADRDTWLIPSALLERTAFVGRGRERSNIAAAVDHAFHGSGAITLLGGGAGVGKTRLAIECARDAAFRGALVLIGHCYESEEPHPYLPFVEMLEAGLEQARSREAFRNALGENAPELAQLMPRLRRLFPDIPPPLELPAEQARRYLFESLCDFLARSAKIRPVFLMLDDMHWADESTLSLLVHLSHRIAAMPVAIVTTYRDDEPSPRANLVKFLEDLLRIGVRPLRLSGLDRDAVAAMLSAMCGREPPPSLIHTICEETQGNPFFVEELYKHLVEEGRVFDAAGKFLPDFRISELDVPENVRLVVRRRLDRVSGATYRALASAAVLGRSFSFKLLESVAEADSDTLLNAIDESLRMGLIVSTSKGPEAPFNFVHELVRQSLLTELSPPRRQRLHLRVARSLQQAYAASLHDRSAEIAHHLSLAGNDADARDLARFLRMAGEHAIQAAAYEDALHHFKAALARHAAADLRDRAELLSELATAERSLGKWEEALAHWRESIQLFEDLGDHDSIARVCLDSSEALSWGARLGEESEMAMRGIAALEGKRTAGRARLMGMLAVSSAAVCAFQKSKDAVAEALAIASELGEGEAFGHALAKETYHHFACMEMAKSVGSGLRAAELLRSSGALWSLAEVLAFAQLALLFVGKIRDAELIGEELAPLAAKLGHYGALMLSTRASAYSGFAVDADVTKLKVCFLRDLEITEMGKLPWVATSHMQLGLAEFFAGDWNGAVSQFEEGSRLELPGIFQSGIATGLLFRQYCYVGDRTKALALLERKRGALPTSSRLNSFGSWNMMFSVVEGLIMLGEPARAAEFYTLVREAIDTGTRTSFVSSRLLETVAGIAAGAGQRWDQAEEHFGTAMRQAQEIPMLLEQADIHRFHAKTLIERGRLADRDRARSMLCDAIKNYEQFGMPQHADLTRSLLSD